MMGQSAYILVPRFKKKIGSLLPPPFLFPVSSLFAKSEVSKVTATGNNKLPVIECKGCNSVPIRTSII